MAKLDSFGRDALSPIGYDALLCSGCGGHPFNDGPKLTGLRYHVNGAAPSFHPEAA